VLPERGAAEAQSYQAARRRHWDDVALRFGGRTTWGWQYHRRLAEVYQFLVSPGQRVLEIGCAQGDLLAAVRPSFGVGVDFSGEMLRLANRRHPELHFLQSDAHALALSGTFDVILLSDLLNDLWDLQAAFRRFRPLVHPRTRILINSYSRLWETPLAAADRLGLARPTLYQNWLTVEDISNLLYLEGFETMRHWHEVLLPLPLPILEPFLNRFVAKLWPFQSLALTNMLVARPIPQAASAAPLVSVIVPARNEAGNIEEIFLRIPRMGRGTELVFVEGHSRDDTLEAIRRSAAAHPEQPCLVIQQTGVGKGDAVRLGFERASGDVLMILDADLTVPPEDLPRFLDVLVSGKGEFANGVRLVYPMEDEAMRFLNLLGNKFFGAAFSWLLGQPVKDTLCGTKVLRRSDYERIAANRAYFGDFDPFGDFDLLLGAAKLNLKILDVPIRYRQRRYGSTNIERWRHGLLLLQMLGTAARRLKFT
jgi:ubiquinone/menaquinone biosynthesis C-methylase UbiE